MKTINVIEIKEAVKQIYLDICVNIDPSVLQAITAYCPTGDRETFILGVLKENAEIASRTRAPLCQDTGMAIVFLEIGQDVSLVGGYLEDAVNQGVREAYSEGYFRNSVLDPISRKNTLDNTPAIIHYKIVRGESVKISCMAKGFGSENMSRLFMLTPSAGIEGIKKAIIDTVKDAGGNPCPPIILGVGIGGTMEKACLMSKEALLRDIKTYNKDEKLDALEKELLIKINSLGIGAEGYGGKLTALKVLIKCCPTHIAGLPVAVTVQCHASRHKEVIL